jgi:D-glycero-alpha-D-manno-heptose-7-phosphate kinase
MILTRSPLRITLGGGGTDLESYYQKYEGFLIAGAINKYVYVSVTRPFSQGIILKYSKVEKTLEVDDIQNPIIRESIRLFNLSSPQIEISTIADIPSGTGLGSSGSFTTGLLRALHAHFHKPVHANELAELACDIEINKLNETIGKQDQYISAFGGLTTFTFKKDGSVIVEPLSVTSETIVDLEDNLLLFYTGQTREASKILKDQETKSRTGDFEMIENLHFTKELGLRSKLALESGNLEDFALMMNEHWVHKKNRSNGMTNESINKWYEIGLRNGALGGKVVGAGGGGFLMFYAHDKSKLRKALKAEGLEELRFGFDFDGTKVILS